MSPTKAYIARKAGIRMAGSAGIDTKAVQPQSNDNNVRKNTTAQHQPPSTAKGNETI